MWDVAPHAETILDTLKELEDFVSTQPTSIIPHREPLLSAIETWKRDAIDAPGRLRPLLDLGTIPSLAAVRHWQGQGVGFFLPIIIAWFVLGIAEVQYQLVDTEQSFFTWWSGQALGPATYSFAIAILLFGIVAFRFFRDRVANKADQAEEALLKLAAMICVQAARVMDDANPLGAVARGLTSAADRLGSVGSSLSALPRDTQDYLQAAQTAGVAVAKLDEVTTRLAGQVELLASSIDSTSGVVAAWDERLAPVRETLDTLTRLSAQSQDRSTELSEQLGILVSVLPSAVDVANTSGQAAQEVSRALPELVSVTNTLASAVTALRASQTTAQELITTAQLVVAFLDDRIDDKRVHHDWPSVTSVDKTVG